MRIWIIGGGSGGFCESGEPIAMLPSLSEGSRRHVRDPARMPPEDSLGTPNRSRAPITGGRVSSSGGQFVHQRPGCRRAERSCAILRRDLHGREDGLFSTIRVAARYDGG